MATGNDILDELRSWNSLLADMPRTMPFAVPSGYFDALHKNIEEGIKSADKNYPLPLGKRMPYDVPGGYFEELPAQMLALTHEPALSVPKTMPFEVPQGYFDNLPEQVLKKVRGPKIIPLGRRVVKNLRWAAAAILILSIGIGSYKMLNPSTIYRNPTQELAQVSTNDISAYVEQNIDDFDADMLENSVASANNNMQSLSDEDIINYLDETGWNTTVTN